MLKPKSKSLTKEELNGFTKDELFGLCDKSNIAYAKKWKKENLIDHIIGSNHSSDKIKIKSESFKRDVSDAMKKLVAGKQKYKCANSPDNICNKYLNYECPLWTKDGSFDESGYEIDHINELSVCGDNSENNLQALCLACHRVKTKRFSIKCIPLANKPIEEPEEKIIKIIKADKIPGDIVMGIYPDIHNLLEGEVCVCYYIYKHIVIILTSMRFIKLENNIICSEVFLNKMININHIKNSIFQYDKVEIIEYNRIETFGIYKKDICAYFVKILNNIKNIL